MKTILMTGFHLEKFSRGEREVTVINLFNGQAHSNYHVLTCNHMMNRIVSEYSRGKSGF